MESALPARLATTLVPGVWRASQQAAVRAHATGHAGLDRVLPGGGWPIGAVSEILYARPGVGELSLALPLLARLTQSARPVALVAPPMWPCAPRLAASGLRLERLLVVEPDPQKNVDHPQILLSAEQLLRAGAGAVLLWLTTVNTQWLRRLQLAAESSDSCVLLLRPDHFAAESTPSALRLSVWREHGAPCIQVLKCRGARPIAALMLHRPPAMARSSGDPLPANDRRLRKDQRPLATVAKATNTAEPSRPNTALPPRIWPAHAPAGAPSMLWLCLYFPRLPLSALGADGNRDAAVVDQHGSHRWLITGTADCAAGTPLSRAAALHPGLQFKVRRRAAEQEALRSLAYWAYRYGQPVTADIRDLAEPGRVPQALLWVEIGQSLALFGGLAALLHQLHAELPELGHAAQAAVAPTRAGAALLACAGVADPVLHAQDLPAQIHDLPLNSLHWPGEILSALAGVGFRRLGELLAVPRAAFVRRFGAEYRLALDQLTGAASEPCEAIVPPETFRRRFELGAEIEAVENLQFPLRRLCAELQAYLRARDRGLRSVTLAVGHAGARETRIHAQFVDPHRDGERIFNALRERLERDGLPLAAREMLLLAEDFAEAVVPQGDLFDPRAGQAQVWAAAIERIRARLGEDAVWTPRALEDHRPEHSTGRHDDSTDAAPFRPSAQDAHRPTFLLPRPWPMPPPQIPPEAVFERIESGWWDERDTRRDYLTVDLQGSRAWVFREVATQAWFLHGWWS